MKKTPRNLISVWKGLSGFFRAFLILAAAFLIVGLGTLGSVKSTGKAYELPAKRTGDALDPAIVFQLYAPEGYSNSNITVKQIYVNAGTLYTELGKEGSLMLGKGGSETSSFPTTGSVEVTLANVYTDAEGSKAEGALFRWHAFPVPESGWRLSTYSYYKLTARGCNILVNEIVFVGVDNRLASEEQKPILIRAGINPKSVLPYDSANGETLQTSIEKAGAVLDRQSIPSLAQSSFFRFGEREAYTLMSISEMRMGGLRYTNDVYNGDRVYNALGVDILALGTLIFGMSPFGLRFFPMLASFGVLVIGTLFTRRLFKSDRAGLIFAVLYALCGASFSLGHLGTPLMLGVFFVLLSLYTAYLFYANGMREAKFPVNLLCSGLSGAAAIAVNGACLIPILGVVALFVAGMFRQEKARRYYLDKAIARAEEAAAEPAEEDAPDPKAQVAEVLNEYHYKNTVAPTVFGAFLVFGGLVLSLLALLPMYFPLVKLYSPDSNVLLLGWRAFAGGFVGRNPSSDGSPLFRILFRGSGDVYAVTATGLLPLLAAAIAGIYGIVTGVVRLVFALRSEDEKQRAASLRTVILPFVGLLLSLALSFTGGSLGFMLLSYIFAFVLAAGGVKEDRTGRTLCIAGLVLLSVCFVLFAVFTFSIPLPASLIGSLVK